MLLQMLLIVLGAQSDTFCGNTPADAKLLQAAIDASAPGDQVRIHGSCMLNATVCLNGDRAYFGDSRAGTVLKQAAGARLPALLASDSWCANDAFTGAPLRLSSLTLDGNAKENPGARTVGLMLRSWSSVVDDVHVTGASGDGIRLTNVAEDNTTGLKSSQVNGRISNVFVEASGGSGIRVLDSQNACTDWSLVDSWISTSNESAVLLDNAAGWQIRGLHTYGSREHAIYANRCFATSIVGNYVEDMGHAGRAGETYYGIACHAQSSAASLIADNKVFAFGADPNASSTFVYVGVSGVAGTAGDVGVLGVQGNIVRGANRTGDVGLSYSAAGHGAALEVSSVGNHVHGTRTPRQLGARVTVVSTL